MRGVEILNPVFVNLFKILILLPPEEFAFGEEYLIFETLKELPSIIVSAIVFV